MVDWSKLGLSSSEALSSFKSAVGEEVASQLMSIPDTIAFIEFIYEESVQTALFAIYQAHKNGQDDMARQILNYLTVYLLPDAIGMTAGWGKLNPATQNCFERFFEASKYAADSWAEILATTKEPYGTLVVYTNVNDVTISIDGKEVGTASPVTPVKTQVEAGSHSIEAKKSGYEVEARSVNIKAGDYRAIKINMKEIQQ